MTNPAPKSSGAPAPIPDHASHPALAKDEHAGHGHASGGPLGEKSELIFAIVAGVLLATGWLLQWRQIGPDWLPKALYVGAYAFGGWFTAKEALENLRERRFAIDTLTLVAAMGAAA
ncbi:MAG: heavy metal translocating P-type ATPase, partial [Burkholderiales bacterium]